MFVFSIDDHIYRNIHFIGIGGVSMSGLAEILISQGYKVSGSDAKASPSTERLEKLGAEISIGHDPSKIDEKDLVIYTDAIGEDNPEYLRALDLGIKLVDRASFLGALMKNYKESIGVSGTHGKTTTTSMLSTILNRSSLDPTILLGGQLKEIGGNVKLGARDYILTEACEYKGNILKYFPSMAIVLNIDEDHLDYFKSIDHILETFVDYGKNIQKDGYLIINKDDPHTGAIIEATKAKVVGFSIDQESDYRATNIEFTPLGQTNFDLVYESKTYPFTINTIGKHNVYNALAAITSSHKLGLSLDYIRESILLYSGVARRLEYKGDFMGAKIIDDYAHHPTEVQVTLEALRKSHEGRIFCIFQPHTYTRTQILFESFSKAFKDADLAIITDIYAARELDNGSIHSKDLVKAIDNTRALYLSSFQEIEAYLIDEIKEGDLVVTMGAGNVYTVGESLINKNIIAI